MIRKAIQYLAGIALTGLLLAPVSIGAAMVDGVGVGLIVGGSLLWIDLTLGAWRAQSRGAGG